MELNWDHVFLVWSFGVHSVIVFSPTQTNHTKGVNTAGLDSAGLNTAGVKAIRDVHVTYISLNGSTISVKLESDEMQVFSETSA